MKSLGKIVIVGTIAVVACGIAMFWQSPSSLSFAGKQELQAMSVAHNFLESDAVEVAYEKYLKDFKKKRSDSSRANFEANYRIIQDHNSKKNRKYDMVLNEFSDMSSSSPSLDNDLENQVVQNAGESQKPVFVLEEEENWINMMPDAKDWKGRDFLFAYTDVLAGHLSKLRKEKTKLLTFKIERCTGLDQYPSSFSPAKIWDEFFKEIEYYSDEKITGYRSAKGCNGKDTPTGSIDYTAKQEKEPLSNVPIEKLKELIKYNGPLVAKVHVPKALKEHKSADLFDKVFENDGCYPKASGINPSDKQYLALIGYGKVKSTNTNCIEYWILRGSSDLGQNGVLKICIPSREPKGLENIGSCNIQEHVTWPKVEPKKQELAVVKE